MPGKTGVKIRRKVEKEIKMNVLFPKKAVRKMSDPERLREAVIVFSAAEELGDEEDEELLR